ncbi:MAG: DEAD/DEAH box helicase, partial [Erythrobacter sp.]|nr:DEAD/DEAH box helicase [Erythrobacter sp.]
MPDLSRILAAKDPLTLASLPRGSLPLVLADLARAAKRRAVFIAPDDAAMRAAVEAAQFFAPEVDVFAFPAWDCLPYDRASPALSISAERLAALHRLQQPGTAQQLLVTTVNAVLQRVLTPFRVRESVREFRVGTNIGHTSLAALLIRQGYSRTDTVIDHGEFAVRGSIVDIFPSSLDSGLRLDFFGDELESLRLFDPATQLTVERVDAHLLLPASEALLDEETIKRFRSRYRELFGANATQDPLYEAVSDGRRLAGMEHWLPLFEDRLATLFDHLAKDDVVVIDQGAVGAAEERLTDIADYHAQRSRIAGEKKGSYRPLAADALYLTRAEFDAGLAAAPAHRASGFVAESGANVLDFGFRSARDFSPERGRGENVYEAAAAHLKAVSKAGRKPVFAAYSNGSARRIASILEEAGASTALANSWQQALGLAAKGRAAVVVLPLETGFASDTLDLITEADVLGDRLVRRRKKRRDSDAFLAELQALSRGDLVVHIEHGIGRYLGLEPIPVGKSQHDCVALEYAGGDKLFIPVENIDVLSRYGSSEQAVPLDRLGGEAWQRRRAKLKERITAIAGELMQVAAARALRQASILATDHATLNQFVDRFPWSETEDQERAIADVLGDLESGRPMDRLVCGDVGFGKTEVALRAAFVAAMAGQQVAIVAPTTLLARQHYQNFTERFAGFPLEVGRLSRLVSAKEAGETREGLENGQVDLVVGTHAILSKNTKFKNLGLVIVDEEQRFGVTHKEKLKQLRADVHVLTLTATPIPRTLQMAMSGLRELSTIQTP